MGGRGWGVTARRRCSRKSVLLFGSSFRTRHLVSYGFVAGCRGAVEAGNSAAAMDRVGQLRVWRTAVHVLSTAFLATGGFPGERNPVERGGGHVCCWRADICGHICVRIVATAGEFPLGGVVWSRLFRRESIRTGHHLCAK